MALELVAGGYRDSLVLLSFDPTSAKLKTIAETPVASNPSWVEPSNKDSSVIYSLSENPGDEAKVFSLKRKGDKYDVTGERKVADAPCHIHSMKDGSGIIVATYLGGTAVYFPTGSDGSISADSKSPELHFPFAYEGKEAPNKERQDKAHCHQIVETDGGKIFAADLGSDKIWAIERDGESGLKIKGYLQCPPGSGPRHMVLSPDEKHLYALTELSHEILLFTIDDPSYPLHPTPDFRLNIVPDTVPKSHQYYMDSAEIQFNPAYPNVLYASNRWELHLHEKQKDLPKLEPTQPGDTVCVVTLSEDGGNIVHVKQVRTGCDAVRGMRVSKDGKWVALAGQEAGGVEIWQIGGKGDEWKLAAKDESIKGITDLAWL